MKTAEEKATEQVGIIIGRFQTNELHEGHKHIIREVTQRHKRVIIFLGVSVIPSTKRNPLDFFTRKVMIENEFPGITVLSIPDVRDDKIWSKNLDKRINEIVLNESVILYGSRDSFIKAYTGTYKVEELEAISYQSATVIRNDLTTETLSSKDFRTGVIYGINHRYTTCYPTIDVAITDGNDRLLLARKDGEKLWRFIGGFIDPAKDSTAESAVKRETAEETHLEVDGIEYISSVRVDDWRYRSEVDKIMTFFYSAKYIFGKPEPDDDIVELRWFSIEKEIKDNKGVDLFVEEHRILYQEYLKYLKINKHV